MTYLGNRIFALEVLLSKVEGYGILNKFGQVSDCSKDVRTDVWNGAGATAIWIPPTQARVHDISSSSIDDSGVTVGTGMRTVRIHGLTDWNTPETTEDIILNGTTGVPTVNSYVIIHRMMGLTFGDAKTNLGSIKATAQEDATITALIPSGEGQSLMAIYGIASTQRIILARLVCSIFGDKDGVRNVAGTLLVRENAHQSDSAFITKERFNFSSVTASTRQFSPTLIFNGPCIVKVQVECDTTGSQITSAFDAFVVDD